MKNTRKASKFEELLINAEHFNHFFDLWYLFFNDHDPIYVFLLILALIVAPLRSWGHGGITTQRALLGLKTEGHEQHYENSRWLIKTNICIYENIP
jgi:hypothetical protein